jgi:hypothetical protein
MPALHGTAYFVSTLGLEPEPFLLSLLARSTYLSKNRIAFRLSGAPSVQSAATRMRPQLSSKPIKVTCSRLRCQPIVPTGFPPVLHMSESSLLRKHRASHPAAEALFARDRTRLPLGNAVRWYKKPRIFGTSRSGSWQLGKRPFGGSCEKRENPSRILVPECEPRGRG